MSKSQNTKNEQQNNLHITSEQLTEKYLNGNLHDGYEYFVKNKDGEISTMYLYNDVIHWCSFKIKKLKVLAPVPSYEEWKASYNCMLENEVLRLENAQLKELLKECRPALVRFVSYDDSEENARILLMNKINEVLR